MTAQTHAPELPPPYQLVQLAGVDGTNMEARRRVEDGAPDKTVIWASSQSAGRGRRGRSWSSPVGNLYFSILIRPKYPAAEVMQLGFIMANAIANAVEGVLAKTTSIQVKWPNDVMVNGKKISGILLESESSGDNTVQWAIIGVGVNIESQPSKTEGDFAATSIASEGGDASIGEMLSATIRHFDAGIDEWREHGFAPVRKAWLERAYGIGKKINVRLPNETIPGTFKALDKNGALVMVVDSKQEDRIITAGDVFFSSTADKVD
ncbi:MAG: biotin--[acetyl-CoA-carboxylase] ligase [Rhodospirillaceae bacterium]|nr:biotin--[acetyl-CoA-carboxylase] ligase [Rhodospirillaceae bacterium]